MVLYILTFPVLVSRQPLLLKVHVLKCSPQVAVLKHLQSQQMSRLLQNTKVRHRVYNSPPLIPVLSQMNPIHTPTLFF
jgi:hypothetical protein